MKNFNLIEWLQTDSHGKQSATRDHHGTKSRELPDNPRLYRYPCATLALPLRYVAMIFAVLVMSMANIGMAWGASPYNLDITSYAWGGTGNKSANDGTVTISGYIQSKTYNNTGSTKVAFLDGSNYLTVSATSACITSITVTANTDNNSNTHQIAYQTSADGSSWSASTNIGTCANRTSAPTSRTANFSPAVRYVRFTKGGSNSISVGAISITYTDGGGDPDPGDECTKIFWFAKAADATTAGVENNTTTFTGTSTGSNSASGSITIDGKSYSVTGRGSTNNTSITFSVPANKVGTLYGLATTSSSNGVARTLTLTNTASYSETQSTSTSQSVAGEFTFTDMPTGSYTLAWDGNGAECMLCLKLCDAVTPSCTAPTAVYVTQTAGSADMIAGESFTLSAATSTGVEEGATYQWYRNSTEVGTNSPTFTVPSCTKVDAGTYWCKITNPCSADAHTTNVTGFGIKVWQVLLCESSTWNSYDLTSTGTKIGRMSRQLAPGTYYIKLTHNNGVDFGVNTGETISEISATTPSPWTLYGSQNNIKLTVTTAGEYTFDVNYTSADYPTLSVTYPPSTISSCDKIYFCPTVNSIATGNAKFSIYFYNATTNAWANCYLVSGTEYADDAKYVAFAPSTATGWTGMIVVRDDEYASSFSGIWNQSQDITYNGYNYIVGTGWSNDKFTNNLNSFYSSTTPAMSAASYATTVGETTNASTNLTGATITYASDNTSIATINSSGVITGVAAGETTITASVGSCTVGSATITVSKNTPTQYTVSGTASICSGDNTNITLSGSQTGASYQLKKGGVNEGEPKAGTGSSLTWTVSAAGTYTVSAVETAKYLGGDMTDDAVITVNTPVTISWNNAPANGTIGGSMTASVTTNYATGVTYAVTSASPAGCVTIHETSGAISYVAAGTATITATVTGAGNYCSTANVTQSITVNKKTPTKQTLTLSPTSVCAGGTATITMPAEVGVTYKLYHDNSTPIDGTQQTASTTTVTWEVGLHGNNQYKAKAIETAEWEGKDMNNTVTLSQKTATSISSQPTSVLDATVGVPTSLSVTAAGENLSYQWKQCATVDGTYTNVASGGNSATYNVTPAAAGTIYYKVVVTGDCGTVTSDAARIVAAAAVTYTVTYEYNGADGGSRPESATGASVTLPEPTKTGYELDGWYTTAGTKVEDGGETYSPTADITLYARWTETCSGGGGGSTTTWEGTPDSYTDGSFTVDDKLIVEADPNDASKTAIGSARISSNPTNINKTCITINSTDKYITGYMNDASEITSLTVGASTNQDNTSGIYVVLFSPNSSFSSGISVQTYTAPAVGAVYDEDVLIHEFTPASGTKYFRIYRKINQGVVVGDYTSPSGGIGSGQTIRIFQISVDAGGSSSACNKVLYHGNGAESGYIYDPNVYDDGDDPEVLGNTTGTNGVAFVKDGYVFQGWATSAGGSVAYSAGDEIENIDDDVNLYAVWEEEGSGYTVTYNGSSNDDGIVPTDASSPYIEGATVTVLGNTGSLTRTISDDAATFYGWNTNSNMYGGTHYDAGATFAMPSSNVTLYAVWGYSITWNLNGGEWVDYTAPTHYIYGQGLASLPNAAKISKAGNTFDHWELEYNHSTITSIATDATGNVQLNAIWSPTCSAHGLAYATASVEKNMGDAAFTNTLTNPHSLVVTYSSSPAGVATVNETSGMVTIVGAGSTTITATWAGNATYCAGTATYTLTVSSGCTPQSLSKVVLSVDGSSVIGTATGYNDGQYTGTPEVKADHDKTDATNIDGKSGDETGYKMGSGGNSIVFATLKGTSFQAGDKVRIGITRRNDTRQVDSKYNILTIYYGTSKSDATALTTINTGGDNDNSASTHEGAGFYEYTLTAEDVTTIGSKKGIGLFRESSNGENPYVYSAEIIGCREWAVCTAPDAVAAGSVTGEGAAFTITDALNTNNYEIYYSTSSTAPTAETSATVSGISSKSRAVTGLTAETTYYYWVRSNCGGATKSSWVAGTPTTFTTEAAAATNSVTYNGNGSTGGSVPTDDTAYEEGDVVTVLGNTGSLVKAGQTFLGWSTSATASSGTFYPAGYKFYMPNAAVTLYAVWGSTGCETLVSVAANSATTVSATVGSGTVNSPSSQGYAGAIKLNSSGYIELTPKAGSSFAAGNKITITMYCGADASKTIGFRLANKDDGNSMSASVAKRTEKTFEYTIVSGDITSGKIKIYRYGSESWFVSAIVEDCSGGGATGHTVTFNMNGYGSAIADIANVPSGSKISAPIPSPTAVGAEFGGWYKEAGCSNPWIFASDVVNENKTLYAKWTTCAPSISGQPSGNTYTQDAAATALSVTASGEGLNYQWYTSENGDADIQGSSAIPGATSASYTPSTALLGTIYYFCVVSNTCGNAVSNKAAITVNDSKPAPTANWTGTEESPKSGGKGWTVTVAAKKNDGSTLWDGDITTGMLTASAGVTLSGLTANNSTKTITGTYSLPAGVASPITFTLTLPATGTQAAASLDHNVSFTPCAGGVSDSYKVRVRKTASHVNNYYYWDNTDGWISPNINNSINSEKSGTAMATDFDSIYNTNTQYVWVRTYHANIKKVRIYAQFRAEGMTVSQVYKHTDFFTANDSYIVSYSAEYNGNPEATGTGEANAFEYVDITLTEAMDANDILLVKFSDSRVRPLGAVLGATGDGGDQTTVLTWSNGQASGATLEKQEDAADFTITAVRDATALKSLGLISYTSSNTTIATIDAATGLVHIADNIDFGSDEFKTTTITATLAASGCYKKAVITYILKVTKYVCTDKPGTITYVDRGCSGMDLTLEGYEEGATIKWYRNGTEIPSATSATYSATAPGEYYAVTHMTCDITSTNSVTLESATATAEKIVDSWYVKNGRRTPDIALVQTTGATSFTVTSGGTPVENIGGCTFELKDDGIIYLHGQKEDGSAPSDMSAGDMTITITVSGCTGELSGLDITIHKQAETAKPSVAFVVDGTLRKDGGTATSVSEAKTRDRDLWKYLENSFTLTGCNVYWSVDSKELREYYSQYDAILITDDPDTHTAGTGGVPYVKAFGTMVDVRPILTMEAFVGRYSDGGWHVYNASPSSPNPRQVEMKLECKNHDIFAGLDPNASDNVRTTTDEHDNEYWHVIMVDTTVAPYHNTSKDYKALPALQGFDPHKFDHMLGVGTIADETLQGGVERQEEPAARMMILGIQNEAMAALTNEGKLIIKNAIEYLLKTNMEDVNDCSNYFTGGPSGTGDNWATPENWSSGKVPDFESRVRILRPVVISGGTKAIVARVDIATRGKSKWVDGECKGKVTVNSQGALIVGGKIRRAEAPQFGVDDLEPTENDDLIVKAATDTHKQGALIFDNSDGDTHAVVEMWNPSHWEVEGGKKKKYWSYVAVPIQEADIPNFFWYGFTYLYDETSGWIKKGDGTSLYPFQGIGASLQEGNMETFYGPLATTESQDITLTYTGGAGQGMNLIGNSWTAPIQIANFEEDDFGDATAEVWVFNTWHTNDGHGDGTTTTAGQWNTIPINAPSLPGYEGLKVIPAMQAFEVNTTSETTLHLDYDRLVRAGRENLNEPMRAPRRSAAKQIEATMRVRVSGESTHTDVYLLKDARFSDGFDNGWDGHFLSGDDRSAQLYAISEDEGALAFMAQPEIEGTVLGFAPSRYGNDYTFSFYYLGDDEYYLNDIKLQKSTLISEEESYFFTFEEGDTNRFFISRTAINAPEVATGMENLDAAAPRVQKIIYNDKLYIIRGGRLYDATGKVVK